MTLLTLSEKDIERGAPRAWLSSSALALSASEVIPRISEVTEALVPTLELTGLQSKLQELAELREGWDSYGAPPIERFVLEAVARFLEQLPWGQIRPPHIVPTSRGGVSLEWHRPGLEFSIEVEPTAESQAAAWAFFADDDAGDTWEEELLSADQARLTAAFRRVAAR